jgi:hypothetical protein
MCWRCVSESVPYVLGSVGLIRVHSARLARAARRQPSVADPTEPGRDAEVSRGRAAPVGTVIAGPNERDPRAG